MTEGAHYWQRFRTSRRRLLAASGSGLTALSLSLLGCREEQPAAPEPVSSRIGVPNNTTALARSGGVFKSFLLLEPPSLDPMASNSPATFQLAGQTYPRLLKFTAGVYPELPKGAVEGDLAESYEFLPDKLTLTFKIRPGLKWDARPPTSGRIIDASDVVASWNRFARLSPFRYDLVYHADLGPGAAVESVSSPNASTVVFKLKQPDPSVLSLFASNRHFFVMPKEAEVSFDPRLEMRGYGPWLLTENRPGIIKVWGRNPEYYIKGRPLPDTMEQINAGEYNARLAQFKAGLIWPSVVSQDDLLATMDELPDLILQRSDSYPVAPAMLGFGYDATAPWKDERLRQAVSMLIDRESFVSLRSNRDSFEAVGLPVEVRYHTAVGAGWDGYWNDPRSGAFGGDGKYYTLDVQTARQLMSAAGFPDGIDTLLHYNGGMEYAASYTRNVEMVSAMLYSGGIRASLDPRPYADDWLPNYQQVHTGVANVGKPPRSFPGIALRPSLSYPTPATQFYSMYHRLGGQFHGMSSDGKNPHLGDNDVNTLVEAMRREADPARQQMLSLELAKVIARKAYEIPVLPFAVPPYTLSWPVIGNLGVHRNWPGGVAAVESAIHQWVDASQSPLRVAAPIPGGTP